MFSVESVHQSFCLQGRSGCPMWPLQWWFEPSLQDPGPAPSPPPPAVAFGVQDWRPVHLSIPPPPLVLTSGGYWTFNESLPAVVVRSGLLGSSHYIPLHCTDAFEGSCPFLAAVRSVLVAGAVPRRTDLTASSWCLVRADHFRWQQRPPQSSRSGCRVCARLCPKAWGSVKNHSLIVSNLEKVWRVHESIVIQVPY